MSDPLEIGMLLPQHGAMVLIDAIVSADETSLVARATSHRSGTHPLAHAGRLPAWAGIEYAAQAMAAHFTLGVTPDRRTLATVGLLGGLRDVVCSTERLDDVAGALLVTVRRLTHGAAGSIYAFRLQAEADGRELQRGRATVVQQLKGEA